MLSWVEHEKKFYNLGARIFTVDFFTDFATHVTLYENKLIQIYWKFDHQKMKIYR